MFALGQKKSFGIDIGTQTIKIAEIINDGVGNYSITNYSIWDDDLDKIIQQKNSDSSLSPQDITNIIEVMIKESGMHISNAYIALPSYMAFFAVMQLPMLEEKELLTTIPLEAKKHIPVPLSSVQLDWINLGKNQLKDQYNILIMAIPNTIADKYIAVSKALGIKIKGFELDCFSTLRSINLPKEQVCIIDIGARTSTVMIVNADKKLQTIQSFDFGGNHITESIAKLRDCSVIEAENIKKKNGISDSDSEITELIQSKINSFMSNDVVRLLRLVGNSMDIKVDNFVIVGGMSKMFGIKDYIEFVLKNQLNNDKINISMADSISQISIKGIKDKNTVLDIWQDLILSVGVALKDYIE